MDNNWNDSLILDVPLTARNLIFQYSTVATKLSYIEYEKTVRKIEKLKGTLKLN